MGDGLNTDSLEMKSCSDRIEDVEPPIPMLILERGLIIRWVSRAAIDELRLCAERLMGRSWYDLFPESRARQAQHEEMFAGTRATMDLPRIALSLGCGTQYFSLRLRPLKSADGSIDAILGVGEDVTAQVLAEQTLRASEERFRAISTYSRDIVVISAADGTVLFTNAAIDNVLGPRVAPAGATIFDHMHADDMLLARELFLNLVSDPSVGITRDIEVRLRHIDGGWRWLHFTGSNLLENPAVAGIVLNGRDVTDRKRADLALQASERRLETALLGAQSAYWSIDLQADTTDMSDTFFTMTGIDRLDWEADTEPWCTRVHPDDAPMGCARYRAHLSGQTATYEHEYRLATPRGWMWLQDRGEVLERDTFGHAVRMFGTTTDISSRKALEREIVDALHREQRRICHNLHDGLGQQLAGLALLVDGTAARVLAKIPELAAELKAMSGHMRQCIEDTQTLIRGILPASIERGDIGPALQSLADEFSMKYGMRVRCEISGIEAQRFPADMAQQIYRIAQESLNNSVLHGRAAHATLSLSAQGKELIFAVTDNGTWVAPIAPANTGMGLKIMAYRANTLGGTLSVEPLLRGGTRLVLHCPIARRRENAPPVQLERSFCNCIQPHPRNVHVLRAGRE